MTKSEKIKLAVVQSRIQGFDKSLIEMWAVEARTHRVYYVNSWLQNLSLNNKFSQEKDR